LAGVSGVFRAGQSVEDHCRQCHEDRTHTVIVVDGHGEPLRVACDFCRSEHNYRGGPRMGAAREPARPDRSQDSSHQTRRPAAGPDAPPIPLVTDRERQLPPVSHDSSNTDLELILRRIIREETGLTPVAPAEKWRGGHFVLRPGRPGVQEKSWPIETFFHKVVMLRNRLRTLEQQLNASELPDDVKVKLQSYITGCYGSLTSFNILFADENDRFVGAAQD
jgi:hypothetical protein